MVLLDIFLFQNDIRGAVTVKVGRYHAMLNESLFPKVEENDTEDI